LHRAAPPLSSSTSSAPAFAPVVAGRAQRNAAAHELASVVALAQRQAAAEHKGHWSSTCAREQRHTAMLAALNALGEDAANVPGLGERARARASARAAHGAAGR
jgi:hypothetical protein